MLSVMLVTTVVSFPVSLADVGSASRKYRYRVALRSCHWVLAARCRRARANMG
jgi:hypothetical protein